MNTKHSQESNNPKSGLSLLEDGRVQLIFNLPHAMDNICELPTSIYSVTRELLLVEDHLTNDCKKGLSNLLSLGIELTPFYEDMSTAYTSHLKAKTK